MATTCRNNIRFAHYRGAAVRKYGTRDEAIFLAMPRYRRSLRMELARRRHDRERRGVGDIRLALRSNPPAMLTTAAAIR